MNKQYGPVIFGEVLFDVFPDGARVLGGAPFNVAWHCHAFGLNPLFISKIGNDTSGKKVLSAMRDWGMETKGLQIDSEHKTGVVAVSFNDGEPAYDIVENSAWDFIEDLKLPETDQYDLLYHGSLSMRNNVSANSLASIKKQFSDSVFVDVNLRPPWWSLSQIIDIIQPAKWIKLNVDELALIVPQRRDMLEQAQFLMSQYNFDFLVVTQGAKGAIALNKNELFSVEPERNINRVDTVGAGDAFTSVLLLGLLKGWPLQQIINRAQQFASAIVGVQGATIQDKEFYKPFIHNWSL